MPFFVFLDVLYTVQGFSFSTCKTFETIWEGGEFDCHMYAAGAELSEEVGFDGVGHLPRTGKRVTSVQDLRDLGQASWALSDILEAPDCKLRCRL